MRRLPFLVSSTAILIIFLLLQSAFSERAILPGVGVGDGVFVVSTMIVLVGAALSVGVFVGVDDATISGNNVYVGCNISADVGSTGESALFSGKRNVVALQDWLLRMNIPKRIVAIFLFIY